MTRFVRNGDICLHPDCLHRLTCSGHAFLFHGRDGKLKRADNSPADLGLKPCFSWRVRIAFKRSMRPRPVLESVHEHHVPRLGRRL